MITEEDWQRAVREEGYRPAFLDGIDLMEATSFVDKISYAPRPPILKFLLFPSTAMCCYSLGSFHDLGSLHEKREGKQCPKSGIVVYSAAFLNKYCKCLADFLGYLVHHEGHHAREFYEDPRMSIIHYPFELWIDSIRFSGKRGYRLFQKMREAYRAYNVRELRAVANQLQNIARRNWV